MHEQLRGGVVSRSREILNQELLRDAELESRELVDLLDRVLDKGIVVDPASRIGLLTDHPDIHESRIIVGSFDADF